MATEHDENSGDDLLTMIGEPLAGEEEALNDVEPIEEPTVSKEAVSTNEEPQAVIAFSAEDGDIFINANSAPTVVILSVTTMADGSKNYRVRFPLVVDKPIVITEAELVEFIDRNRLSKLLSQRDMMRDITSKITLTKGDVFSQNGKVIVQVLTNVFVYADEQGNMSDVVGCSINGAIGMYRDAFEVKAFLFENADEFLSLRNPTMEG